MDMKFTYLRLMSASRSTLASRIPSLAHSENAKNRKFFGIKHAVAHLLSKIYSPGASFRTKIQTLRLKIQNGHGKFQGAKWCELPRNSIELCGVRGQTSAMILIETPVSLKYHELLLKF